MSRDRLAILALGALVVGALILALIEVGGPARGALEKRDEARFRDLLQLQSLAYCVFHEDKSLPETLEPKGTCSRPVRSNDPITGQPYTYERLDETRFRLCADFEDPDQFGDLYIVRQADSFENGCLISMTENQPIHVE